MRDVAGRTSSNSAMEVENLAPMIVPSEEEPADTSPKINLTTVNTRTRPAHDTLPPSGAADKPPLRNEPAAARATP